MDFVKDKIRPLYFRYLGAAFGSALITSIYSIVDMSMVGQYQGPDGTAALAVVAPVWNIIYSLGLLTGIGGSVLFGTTRGKSKVPTGRENEYFTVSVIGSVILAAASWIAILLFEQELLTFFGATEDLLPLAQNYLRPIRAVLPVFLLNQMLAAFLRSDGNPALATAGVLAGGIFNIFGDYIFVFPMNMGIYGAGLATAIGSCISLIVQLSHFFSKKNTLRLVRPSRFLHKARKVFVTGFSTFFIDVAMGILTILFNRQIVTYLGSGALSVYGVIINISTFVQCCAYSVGQASQPIISVNFGAHLGGRIRETLRCALGTVAFFALLWTGLSPAAAAEYFLDLLFPGDHETFCRLRRVCIQRLRDQRRPDPSAACGFQPGFPVVCHAGHRTAHRRLCGCDHVQRYAGASGYRECAVIKNC